MTSTAEKMRQVADQCRVVAHLSRVISGIHDDQARMFAAGGAGPEDICDIVGESTAEIMETLGDILNGMDGVSEHDAWTHPIFAEAHRLFPTGRD